MSAFLAEVLPVAYDTLPLRLSEIGRAFRPDIAVHFGLARSCAGFRLERTARNRFVSRNRDNRGFSPAAGPICAGPETLQSRLPLEAIHVRLAAAGLPVEWSDDAGGYLCNTVFTLSLAHGVGDFRPAMSGFVHVPPTTIAGLPGNGRIDGDALLAGARIVLGEAVSAWHIGK